MLQNASHWAINLSVLQPLLVCFCYCHCPESGTTYVANVRYTVCQYVYANMVHSYCFLTGPDMATFQQVLCNAVVGLLTVEAPFNYRYVKSL